MNSINGIGLLLFLTLSARSLWAEEFPWYEHPKEHLTVIQDTVSQQLQDTDVVGSDTFRCDYEVIAIYPAVVATAASQAVADQLNGFILDFVTKHFDLPPGLTLERRVALELDSLHKGWEDAQWGGLGVALWEATVEYFDHGILSLRLVKNVCIDCSGCPYREYHYHYALPHLSEIPEDSLFITGSRPYLDSVGEFAFRRDNNVPAAVPLRDSGYFIESNSTFMLSPIYAMSDSGITYVYNCYHIGSAGNGRTYAHLTWGQLRPIINPNGPLAWVLKQP